MNNQVIPCRNKSCCPKLYIEYSDNEYVDKESLFLITDDYGGMVKLNVYQLERLYNEALETVINHNVASI